MQPIKFPITVRHKKAGITVKFTSDSCGYVIKTNRTAYFIVGEFITDWIGPTNGMWEIVTLNLKEIYANY